MALIQVLPPAGAPLTATTVVAGRTYTSSPGQAIAVPDFDALVLQANGWTLVQPQTGATVITGLFEGDPFPGKKDDRPVMPAGNPNPGASGGPPTSAAGGGTANVADFSDPNNAYLIAALAA